jgi:hypothetical protein
MVNVFVHGVRLEGMMRGVLATVVCLLAVTRVAADSAASIEGVWKIAQRITPAGNPRAGGLAVTQDRPQPNLLIFTRRYYSEIIVMGGQPRAVVPTPADPRQLTDAEKIAFYNQWRPFTANAGTYEMTGSILVRHPIVAKNVDIMSRGPAIALEVKFEGTNTVWLTPTGEFAATEPRLKLTRVE